MSGRTNKRKRSKSSSRNRSVYMNDSANQNQISTIPIKRGTKSKKGKKKRKNKKNHSVLKRTILILFLLFFLVLLIASGVFVGFFFSDKFAMTKEDLLIGSSNTIIYDAQGNVIAELSGKENRQIISIEEMSDYLPKAFVAIEDERFFQHHGVDIKRTAAATFTYITNSGSSNFGGSTITQQLVKNITNEKDSSGTAGMQRKIKEMSRAYQIEKMISKREILELYLNLIPLAASGADICGVETASRYYFNKSAGELSVEESAFLAGVTHSPSQYNPYKEAPNTERINTRTKTVLGKMKELGFISEAQYSEAIAKVDEGLKFEKGELPSSVIEDYYISAAVDQVVNELVQEKEMSLEYAKSRVYSGGLRIYTAMVPAIQQTVETEYKSDKYVKPGKAGGQNEGLHTQSAMVIIDHKTGRVLACMGGLGTDVNAIGTNRINSLRQPGSSIKPIGVYGPALEKGIINMSTIYDNSPTTFGTKYSPPNATTAKSGLITIGDALEVSSNIVACKVMSELGPDVAIDYMRELGITSLVKESEATNGVSDSNLSTALGGITYGISTLQMAAAYAAIANNGVYIEPTFYTKVEDSSGNILLEPTQETRTIMSEGNAYIMKQLLKRPIEGSNGTAKICKMNDMDVAAKTGTTNDQYDLWLCGFTPYYTAATWFGYDYNEYVDNRGGSPATLIWNDVMRSIHNGLEGRLFEKPESVVTATVCKTSGKCVTKSCSSKEEAYFVEGTVPGKCEGHNSFTVCSETKKLATDYCPHKETIWGLAKPEKEVNATWKTNSSAKYTVISQKCDVHTSATQVNTNKANEDNKQNENKNQDNNANNKDGNDVTVPNVLGKPEATARGELASFNVRVEYKTDATKANGIVLSQSITPGSIAAKQAPITIVVNKVEVTNNSGNNNNNNGGNANNNNNGGNTNSNSNNNNNGNNNGSTNNGNADNANNQNSGNNNNTNAGDNGVTVTTNGTN